MNKLDLYRLVLDASQDMQKNGFVGLDFNMAVTCICSKRLGIKVKFSLQDDNQYEQNVDYWARKRDCGHLHVSNEDEVLQHAQERLVKEVV